MPSPETSFEDRETRSEKGKDDPKKFEALKKQYEKRVKASSFGTAEKKGCLDWIHSGKNSYGTELKAFQAISIKDLELALKNFDANERLSFQQVKLFTKKIKDFAQRDLFSKNPARQKEYIDWYTNLPYDDKRAPTDKKRALLQSHLDLKERKDIADAWHQLPSAVRKKWKQDFEQNNGMEENAALVFPLLERHKALKERFLKLPSKVQDEFRKAFKNTDDFDAREKMLDDIDAERKTLGEQYRTKIHDMQQPDQHGLTGFSNVPESAPGSSAHKYIEWFENLNVSQMRHMLENSSLENRKREECREHMLLILPQLPAKKQEEVRQEFNAAELTGRQSLIARYEKLLPASAMHASSGPSPKKKLDEKAKEFVRREAERELLSRRSEKTTAAFETYAIEEETLTRRERLQRDTHTHSFDGLKRAAKLHSMEDTAHLQEKTEHLSADRDEKTESYQEGEPQDLVLRRRELREHRDIRYRIVKTLKPDVDNKDARLVVDYRNEAGNQINTAEVRATEIPHLQDEVREHLAPVLRLRSREKGISLDDSALEEALDATHLKQFGRAYLRKAA